MPERLVVVATFKLPHVAQEAVAALQAEAIYAETGSGFAKGRSQHEVRVFESDLSRAEAVVASLVGEELSDDAIVCPRCRGRRVAARPPAGLVVIIVGLAAALFVQIIDKPGWLSALVAALSVAGAAFAEHVVGRWRCENCQHVWVR